MCLQCGAGFSRTPSQIKQGRSKYCSLKCANNSFTKPFLFVSSVKKRLLSLAKISATHPTVHPNVLQEERNHPVFLL